MKPRHFLTFVVEGKPQPAGSKKGFPFKRRDGRLGVSVTDDNPKSKGWKKEVAAAAKVEKGRAGIKGLLEGPIVLRLSFYVTRPKFHFGTGRNSEVVKKSAPRFPTVKPDALKLARAVEDGLTGIIWKDDALIVDGFQSKRYGKTAKVKIEIFTL